jgi:hypothetical protein
MSGDRGTWTHHPRHGRQLKVEQCERTMPADERAIRLAYADTEDDPMHMTLPLDADEAEAA